MKSNFVESYSKCIYDYLGQSDGIFKSPDAFELLKVNYIFDSSERREFS
jgi:hypothetical protein